MKVSKIRKTGEMVQIYHKSFLMMLQDSDQNLFKEKWEVFLFTAGTGTSGKLTRTSLF